MRDEIGWTDTAFPGGGGRLLFQEGEGERKKGGKKGDKPDNPTRTSPRGAFSRGGNKKTQSFPAQPPVPCSSTNLFSYRPTYRSNQHPKNKPPIFSLPLASSPPLPPRKGSKNSTQKALTRRKKRRFYGLDLKPSAKGNRAAGKESEMVVRRTQTSLVKTRLLMRVAAPVSRNFSVQATRS